MFRLKYTSYRLSAFLPMNIALVLAIVEAAYHADLIVKDTVMAARVVIHTTKHPKKMVSHPKLATREALHK